jgi:hypothetical protein
VHRQRHGEEQPLQAVGMLQLRILQHGKAHIVGRNSDSVLRRMIESRWVDGSIVNPRNAGRLEMLGCQKACPELSRRDGNPTCGTMVRVLKEFNLWRHKT